MSRHHVSLTQERQPGAPTTSSARPIERLGRLPTTRRIAGAAVIASCLLVAVVLATLPALRLAPAPAVVTPNYSAPPTGLTDYQGLFTTQLRSNYSVVPHGLTDYQRLQAASIARANHSALPRGFTDYQGLFTTQPRPNYSQVPPGLTDYQ